jgi:hypothetical protein
MCNLRKTGSLLILAAVMLAGVGAAGAAIVTPYTQDFSGGAADFQTAYNGGSSTAAWSATGGAYVCAITRTSGASFYAYSSAYVSDLGPATPNTGFVISTLLSNISIGDTSANVTAGLRFLADSTNSNANAYVVDLNIGLNPGKVRLVRWLSGAAKVYPDSLQANQLAVANFSRSDPYRLEVIGSYNAAGLLDISVRVTDMNHPNDLAGYGLALTDITHAGVSGEYGQPEPLGHYFGYYDSSASGPNTTISVTMDNFSVAPEPATLSLLACGALALWRRRK